MTLDVRSTSRRWKAMCRPSSGQMTESGAARRRRQPPPAIPRARGAVFQPRRAPPALTGQPPRHGPATARQTASARTRNQSLAGMPTRRSSSRPERRNARRAVSLLPARQPRLLCPLLLGAEEPAVGRGLQRLAGPDRLRQHQCRCDAAGDRHQAAMKAHRNVEDLEQQLRRDAEALHACVHSSASNSRTTASSTAIGMCWNSWCSR